MNFLTPVVNGFVFAESAKLVCISGINQQSHYRRALSSIMFNGRKLETAVLFKKDVVLPNRSRINGFQVIAGYSKRFTALAGADANRLSPNRNICTARTFSRPKFPPQ